MGWKTPQPQPRGELIGDADLVEAKTDAEDWYNPKPQLSKKVRAAREAAEKKQVLDAAQVSE